MAEPTHNDEIDLTELFATLWQNKLTILLITFFCGVLGVAYALLATEKWTSEAHIIAPRIGEIKNYAEIRRALNRADSNSGVDTSSIEAGLFGNFLSLANSRQNQLSIFSQSPYYQKKIEELDTELARRIALEGLLDQFDIEAPKKEGMIPFYTLTFSAETPDEANETLQFFIDKVNKQALQLFDSEYKDHLETDILQRRRTLKNIETNLQTDRNIRIEVLEEALDTARKAGLNNYTVGRNVDGSTVIELNNSNRLFMLGEKFLSAELDTAKNAPLIYPAEYRETQRRLVELEGIKEYDLPKNVGVRFQLEPTFPTKRDAPKRVLIVLLSLILGGMVGVGYVLVRKQFQSTKA